MSVSVEQQVFWFEITVDDVVRVEVVEGERDLGSVELGHWVREALIQSDDIHVACEKKLTWDLRSRLNSSPPSIKSMTM